MPFKKRSTKFLLKKISFINNYWELFYDSNARSLWFILFHGLIFGCFLQSHVSTIYNDSYFNFRFIVLLLISIICFYLIWFLYAVALSKLFLGHLYISSIFEILKYDSLTYFPLTILLIIGLIGYFYQLFFNMFLWLLIVGIITVAVGKIIFLLVKSIKDKTNIEKIKREEMTERVDNIDPDNFLTKYLRTTNDAVVRKYIVCDEVRNALNIKGLKTGKITIDTSTLSDKLDYSIGTTAQCIHAEGNLKLFLTSRDNEELILDKDANNFMTGWNEYQIPIPQKLSSVDIRWENSIDENIYLAPMITFPAISKKQHKNIIVLIIDALVPEIMGIYNGDFNADNISRFFKDSIIFTNAYAQGEWTLPNFASIAQALYLKHHGVYDPDLYSKPMSTDFKTIAEILQEHGYNTLGYFTGPRLSPGYGHMRGFHRYIYRPFYVGVKKSDNLTITTNAIKFLQKNQRTNNFLFLHYIDTHKPFFQSPENISGRHEAIFNYHIKHSKQEMALGNKNAFYYLRELYIQKFKEVDENLQMLFDYISKYEDDQTTVILTSDHGTPLFDDMEMKNVTKVKKSWKAASFLESVLKVPFMIRLPKSKNHMFNLINEPVEANITILPTVLDIAEIPKPDKIDGITSISNKSKTMMGKGYVIAESIFKTRYNLFVKTKDFKYYLKTGRNRATDEIQSHPGVELFFDLHDKSIEDPNEIQQIKKQVKNILKNEKLENVVS